MREDSNWFSNWEEELPSPEELMPLSQSLIPPDLASAFDIPNQGPNGGTTSTPVTLFNHHHRSSSSPQELLSYRHQSRSTPQPPPAQNCSPEYESYSVELCGGGGGGGGGGDRGDEEPARTLKRPRLVWTPQLHKRFVDAVGHLGIKNAVPKTIMTLMSVDGLTRENVASHLQKYRLYLKRMQIINNGGASNGSAHGGVGSGDSATDHLFASSPVPAHFLNGSSSGVGAGAGAGAGGGARPNLDQFMSYVPVAPPRHQQVQVQQYGQHHRQMGQFGLGQVGGQLDHPFLSRQAQLDPNRNGMLLHNSPGFVEGTTSNSPGKVLSLFPNSDE